MDGRRREVRGLSLGGGRGRLKDCSFRGLMKESLCGETTGMNVSVSSRHQLKSASIRRFFGSCDDVCSPNPTLPWG